MGMPHVAVYDTKVFTRRMAKQIPLCEVVGTLEINQWRLKRPGFFGGGLV